jgi:hypothetical protein
MSYSVDNFYPVYNTSNNITYSISGYIGHIYTLDVCSYFFGLSAPSWSVDSIVTYDPSHSHSKEAITSSS